MNKAARIISKETLPDGAVRLVMESTVPREEAYLLEQQSVTTGVCYFEDGRDYSEAQRAKIFAMCADVAEWQFGERRCKEASREQLMEMFLDVCAEMEEPVERFSLKRNSPVVASMTTASRFIDFIITFCLRNRIPTKRPLSQYAEDLGRYTYRCLAEGCCCISQRDRVLHIHHVDKIGMGNNRQKIDQVGMRALPLLAQYHEEIHQIGDTAFCQKYHVQPIRLTPYLIQRLKKRWIEWAD